MLAEGSVPLVIAGALSAAASLAHLACIALGPAAYRFMGAGERMARAVEAGRLQPTLVTVAIAGLLAVWAWVAFSAAGIGPRLPFTRTALALIAAAYLARGLGFPLLRPMFPGNSTTFWWISSALCLVLGLLYAAGAVAVRDAP